MSNSEHDKTNQEPQEHLTEAPETATPDDPDTNTVAPEQLEPPEDQSKTRISEIDDNDTPTPTVVVDRSSVVESLAEDEKPQHIVKEDLANVDREGVDQKQIKISCHGCGQKLDVTHMEAFSYVECPECSAKIIVPKWFDNYLLEEPGGLGGMATVYRALDISLDREVAIKVLNPDLAVRKDRSDLFLNEARTAATINHFGAIPVYTCGEFEGQPYIVMQYMEKGSLEDKVKMERGQLPVTDVCGWIKDVAEGLDNARRHGIIHHDIKPGNIMLDGDGNAKVGDFGIAQAIHDTRTDQVYEMTKTWLSPHYVSPEKVATGREDYLGDIYSLGATFYHLLTGKTPFDHDDVQQLIRTRLVTDPIEPNKVRIDIPDKISNLVMSMMSREMDNRPNYRDIIKAINHCVKELQKNATKKTQKKVPVKNKKIIKAASAAARSNQNSPAQKYGKTKNPFISWAYYVIISSILAAALVYIHKSGLGTRLWYKVTGKKVPVSTTVPKDLTPEVTWAFSKGASAQAEAAAQKIFDDATADIAKRTQAGLQLALSKYLNKAPKPEESCFLIAERLQTSGLDEQSTELAIIFFLANREISPNSLKDRINIAPSFKVPARLAVLLRGITNKESYLKIDDYFYNLQNAAEHSPKQFWGNAWHERLPAWKLCITKKTGDKSKLEPLFASLVTHNVKNNTPSKYDSFEKRLKMMENNGATAPSTKTHSNSNLLKLSEADFIKSRSVFKNRPYRNTPSLDYDKKKVKSYIDTLANKEQKAQEIIRYNYINSTKEYLISLFARSEYLGPVKTKRYNYAKGQVSLANEHGLFVRRQKSSKSHKCSWSEVPFDQYINFFNYFAQERTKIIGPDMTDDERKKLAAEEYLHLAVLCDWHGRYKEAYKYAKKSIQTYPKYRNKVSKLFMGN